MDAGCNRAHVAAVAAAAQRGAASVCTCYCSCFLIFLNTCILGFIINGISDVGICTDRSLIGSKYSSSTLLTRRLILPVCAGTASARVRPRTLAAAVPAWAAQLTLVKLPRCWWCHAGGPKWAPAYRRITRTSRHGGRWNQSVPPTVLSVPVGRAAHIRCAGGSAGQTVTVSPVSESGLTVRHGDAERG